jgi:hypothetical protein
MAKAKGLEDFRTKHDKSHIVPKKIEDGIKKLGKDGWEYQAEFAKLCGVGNLADFNAYCVPFEADHCVVIGGSKGKRAWAGSKALAEKMRAML